MARHDVPDRRDRLEYAALASALTALRAGPWGWGSRGGTALGRFVARMVPLRREVALENLRHAFPDLDASGRLGIYRGMCENYGLLIASFARFGKRKPEDLGRFIRMENVEAVGKALEGNRGALLLTAHFGNWEALGARLGQMGYPMSVLGGRQRNPLVEDLFARYRGNMGLRSLTVGKSLRPIVEAFEQNQCIATLADQDGGPDGFFLDFLGRKASVQSGLFGLAARRGVPIVTGFATRDGRTWRGQFHDPEWPRDVTSKEEAEIEAHRLAELYTRKVEEYVRRHPDHWFWVHRRWRTRPPGQ